MNNNYKSSILIIILIGIFCLTFSNVFANSNVAPINVKYKVVQVQSGDSIWNIAGRHVSNREDIRDMIATINKVNHLDGNSKIYPGQSLRIPLNSN